MHADYITRIEKVPGLNRIRREKTHDVSKLFRFRANDYYLSLIDFTDPKDPIARIIIPDEQELQEWRGLDASHEDHYTKVPGLQHKYSSTAVLLTNNVCGGFCRFCFRKRLFLDENEEVISDLSEAYDYIRKHPSITNVLLSGGDPLMLSTRRLETIIRTLREIEHVQIIRIGSKIPAFNPSRISGDPDLLNLIRTYSTRDKRIYVMAHFNHPRELTDTAVEALDLLGSAGAVRVNQTPLIRGVNDDPDTLADLFRRLSFIGVPPYYVFQCRPVHGNFPYAVPVELTFDIFKEAKRFVSGLAKRAKLIMSHESGKIEIIGKSNGYIFFKYHQAVSQRDASRIVVFRSNPEAYWLEDYGREVYSIFDDDGPDGRIAASL
jgi:lysine 2,3-aminomutase